MESKKELITEYLSLLAEYSALESNMNKRLETLMAKLDKKIKEQEDQKEPLFYARDLEVGEMLVIIAPESGYNGHTIMRIYDKIVSLSSPEYTWSHPETFSFKGRKLKSGESFTLTQK